MATKTEIQSVFKELGVEPKLDTLNDRIKIQKLVYLSEISGIDLGFSFRWYIHGPYSPELTRVLFGKETGTSSNLSNYDFRKELDGLKSIIGDAIQSSSSLELIASLHYVLSIAKRQKSSEKAALEIIHEQKPQFTKEDVNDGLKIARRLLQ